MYPALLILGSLTTLFLIVIVEIDHFNVFEGKVFHNDYSKCTKRAEETLLKVH